MMPADSGAMPIGENGIEIRSHYLDEKGVLTLSGWFPELYTDYYLHLMQHSLRYEAAHDQLLKEALAALALHLCSRPRDETVAWTWHFAEQNLNLFVTGSNLLGEVTGRVFTEGVRDDPHNLFYAQVVRPQHEMRQSVISFEKASAFQIVEEFYRQSQQQLGRFFDHGDERYRLVLALPGAESGWVETLDAGAGDALDGSAAARLLERRLFKFACDCTLSRIVRSLASLGEETAESLFDEEEPLEITCPRCGARYQATLALLRDLREVAPDDATDDATD